MELPVYFMQFDSVTRGYKHRSQSYLSNQEVCRPNEFHKRLLDNTNFLKYPSNQGETNLRLFYEKTISAYYYISLSTPLH